MRLARACSLVGALLFWPVSAAAGDPTIAREQLKIGYGLAQEGRCAEAVPHLLESLRLDPKALTLINLASCEEKLGKLSDAMNHWVDARARAQVEGARPIEEEATARATALDPRLPRLTIVLGSTAPKDAIVERDGVELGRPSLGVALPIDPGPHAILVKAGGRADATTSITLEEGEAKVVEVDVGATQQIVDAPPTTPSTTATMPLRPLAYAGAGVAALGLGVGAITGLLALTAGTSARAACPDLACSQKSFDDVETGRSLGTVSTVSFVLAGVGAAAGLVGFFYRTSPAPSVADPKAAAGRSTGFGVSVSPRGIVFSGRM